MVGAPSFFDTLFIHITTPAIPCNNPSRTSASFHLPISPPYLFAKTFLPSSLTLPFSILLPFFTCQFLHTAIPTILIKIIHSHMTAIKSIQAAPKAQWARLYFEVLIWPCFPEVLTITNSISRMPIILVYYRLASDENSCDQNEKPSNPPSRILSTWNHYFHTLLIPSQDLTCPLETSCITATLPSQV